WALRSRPPRCALVRRSFPLDGATDRRRLAHDGLLPRQDGVERVAQVVLAHAVLVPRVVDRAVVDELPVSVEQEDLWGPLGGQLLCHRLGLVVEVVEDEALRRGTLLHLVERVLRVAR